MKFVSLSKRQFVPYLQCVLRTCWKVLNKTNKQAKASTPRASFRDFHYDSIEMPSIMSDRQIRDQRD